MADNLRQLTDQVDFAVPINAGPASVKTINHNPLEKEIISKVGKYTGFPFTATGGYHNNQPLRGYFYWNNNVSNDTNPHRITFSSYTSDTNYIANLFDKFRVDDFIHYKDFDGRSCYMRILDTTIITNSFGDQSLDVLVVGNNLDNAFVLGSSEFSPCMIDIVHNIEDQVDVTGFLTDVIYDGANHIATFKRYNMPDYVIDFPIEFLISNIDIVGDNMIITFEDGTQKVIPLNTLLVGVVKEVNGLTPNSLGQIFLTISDIPNLQQALDGKAPLVHTHTISQITNLQAELDNKLDVRMSNLVSNLTTVEQNVIKNKLGILDTDTITRLGTNLSNLNSGDFLFEGAGQTSVDLVGNKFVIETEVGDGNVTYFGQGAIVGGGSFFTNQNNNNTFYFDLTNQIKDDIASGVTAFNWGPHTGLYVPLGRTLTINGQTFDLSANRTWTIPDTVTRLRGNTSGSFVSGDITLLPGTNLSISQSGNNITLNALSTNVIQVLSLSGQNLSLSNGGGSVVLPYTDWSNITNKPATFPPSVHTHTSNQVTALTGYTLGTNTPLSATDTLNAALGKIQAQINAKTSNVGTVTNIQTGTGLTGGPITNSGTIALNANTIASLLLADSALQPGNNISLLNNDIGYITSANLPAPQTLSLSTVNTGALSISNGNTVVLNSLRNIAKNDANIDPYSTINSGFFPYNTTGTTTGYPSSLGGGIIYHRNNNNFTGSFDFYKAQQTGVNELWFRVGNNSSTFFDYEIVASRQWALAQGWITSSSLPTVGNGALSVIVPVGFGVSGSFTANQSGNSSFNISYASGYQGFTTAESNKLANIQPNANNYVHPNHTGDVISVGDGTTTIQPNVVTFGKVQNISQDRFLGRVSSGSGNIEQLTAAQMQAALGYLTSFTETDPTVPSWVKAITQSNINDWNAKQNALIQGTHIDITNNVISVNVNSANYEVLDVKRNSSSLGAAINFINNSGKLGDVGFGVTNNDFTIRGVSGTTLFRINQANNVPYFPTVANSGNNSNIALFDAGNGLWKSSITLQNLIDSIPTAANFITTNTNQTGLSGNKTTDGIWIFTSPYTHINKEAGRTVYGLVGNSSGDVHIGSSGMASPANGTQDYGFYTAYNAYRDTDGNWKHSRTSAVRAFMFDGGHHKNRFSWNYSNNVGVGNILWTELMSLNSSGILTSNGFSKVSATNNDILLGAGGHRPVSDFALSSSIPTVGNGNISYTGTGSIIGGGTSTANQSGNTNYTFDLTSQTKSDIALGVAASNNLGNYVQKSGDTVSGVINFITQDAIHYAGVGRIWMNSTSTAIGGNYTSTGLAGVLLRPQGSQVNTNQVVIRGTGQIDTTNGHGTSADWYQSFSWGNHALAGYALASSVPAQVNLIQGSGISITGIYPNLTIANTAPNITQVLGLTNNILSLNNGGGSVNLDYVPTNYNNAVNATVYSNAFTSLPQGSYLASLSSNATGFPTGANGGLISFGNSASNVTTKIFGSRNNIDGLWYSNGNPATNNIYQVASREWANSQFATIGSIPTVGNGQLSITTGTGLNGSVNFLANQSGNSSINIAIASGYVLPTNAQVTNWNNKFDFPTGGLVNQYIDYQGNWANLPTIPTYSGSTSIILAGTSFQRAALTGDITSPQNSNVTTLSNTGVIAGTYNQVTVDIKGRVTVANNQPYQTNTQVQAAINTALQPYVEGVDRIFRPNNAPFNLTINSKKTIVTYGFGVSVAILNISDGNYVGDELAINGSGEWSTTVNGNLIDKNNNSGSTALENVSALFWWNGNNWLQAG